MEKPRIDIQECTALSCQVPRDARRRALAEGRFEADCPSRNNWYLNARNNVQNSHLPLLLTYWSKIPSSCLDLTPHVFQHPHSNTRLWVGYNFDSNAAIRKASTLGDRWALESTSNRICLIALLTSQQLLPLSATSRRRHAYLSTNHTIYRYSRLTT